MKKTLVGLLLVCAGVLPGWAADAAFKVGDNVKAKFGREWRPATVTKIMPNGWITVSMQMNNTTMTPTLMPDKVIALNAPEPREPGKEYITTPDMREWTMADGTKLPRARVHNWNPKMKKVLLQKENGVCFNAEVIKLSKADQDFLSKLAPVHAD